MLHGPGNKQILITDSSNIDTDLSTVYWVARQIRRNEIFILHLSFLETQGFLFDKLILKPPTAKPEGEAC